MGVKRGDGIWIKCSRAFAIKMAVASPLSSKVPWVLASEGALK